MSIDKIYIKIDGDHSDLTDVLSIEVSEAYKQPCARFSIETPDIGSFGLNDFITINIGYPGDHAEIFQGYIDSITTTRRPGVYEIAGRDIIKLAIEHWIVSIDLENPWYRNNISAENLVRDLLAEATIVNYSGDASSFTFAPGDSKAEFQLVSSWDGVEKICNILAWRCYAKGGIAYFKNIQPTPSGAPVANLIVGNTGTITGINHEVSTENLRNKIVVFGKGGIYAEASAVSPYLPPGFYKTAAVSSELIATQGMADDAAAYNLNLYNRLTETAKVDIIGDSSLRARDTVNVVEVFTGISSDWFVYSITHRIDENGYTSSLHLSK